MIETAALANATMGLLTRRMVLSATLTGLSGGVISFPATPDQTLTATLAPFFMGERGPTGVAGGHLSVDPGNTATYGQDGGLFVPGPELASTQW